MDENMNMNQTPVSSEPSVMKSQTIPPQVTTQPQISQGVNYASFFRRFGASLLDGLIVGVPIGILARVLFGTTAQDLGFFRPTNIGLSLISWTYEVFMINKY